MKINGNQPLDIIHKGLTDDEVLKSRAEHGENLLTPPARKSAFMQFLATFSDPLIVILLIAGAVSVGISFYEYFYLNGSGEVFFEPVGIFMAIFLATGLGFLFEHKAEKEFALLNKVNDEDPVQVIRNGAHCSIPKREVVVGDIIVLETGQEIPADALLLEAISLSVDESTLTGEPLAHKSVEESEDEKEATYPSNVVLRGTKLMEGHGMARVTAVGDATENGKVYREARIDRSVKTPLDIQLGRLGKLISVASYVIGALVIVGRIVMFFTENGADGFDWIYFLEYVLKSVMLAVTLVVVAVPEGLPMAVTLSLAYSMRRMLRTGNLVRKIHACETMGAVTVICTDKTGTLTHNQMRVEEVVAGDLSSEQRNLLMESIAINSTANVNFDNEKPQVLGNPTEGALLIWLAQQKGEDSIEEYRRIKLLNQLPFSTENKYMASTFFSPAMNSEVTVVKGAPEIIMKMCSKYANGLTAEAVEKKLLQFQQRAMRTLAFAWQKGNVDFSSGKINSGEMEFLGFMGISDPVREDVPDAVAEVRKAGVDVKIVTGDTAATACEIGRQIGLEIDAAGNGVYTGAQIAEMTDKELEECCRDIKIIARARPMDKKRMVEALQKRGEIVAVTGDGTNDAPALKAAHVGLSMGDGTAVAKEASDITIVCNSFAGISNAVMWGRSLYRNIQRFILFQLTVNVAACLTVLIGSFMGTQPPLTVTQMLWVNLVMDTFAAMALASLPPSRDVMKLKPRSREEFIITPPMARFIGWVGSFFAVVMIGMLFVLEHCSITSVGQIFHPVISAYKNLSPEEHSIFFTFFVMLQWWNLFNARSFGANESAFKLHHCGEFVFILLLIMVGQILITTFGGPFFNVQPLSFVSWLWILLLTAPVLLVGELVRCKK